VKLTALNFITLDGVYQGPGGPDEDRRGGFERGGWLEGYADEDGGRFIASAYERADALLLGRVTFDIWLPYWPEHDDNSIGRRINAVPKYVPSTTLSQPDWHNTHVLHGDVERQVRELKARPHGEILLQGSGVLLRWLLERDLVDELHLLVYPLVLGDGLRLFPDHGPTHTLQLIESRSTSTGVTILSYGTAA
jgi:dihydrofolate reductase